MADFTKDFIKVSPNGGSGTAALSVTANKNTGAARSTNFKVVGGGLQHTLTCNQKAGFNVIIVGENGSIVSIKL